MQVTLILDNDKFNTNSKSLLIITKMKEKFTSLSKSTVKYLQNYCKIKNCIPIEFYNNRSFIEERARNKMNIGPYLSTDLKNDRNFVLKLAKLNGSILHYLNEEFRDDKEIVLAAVSNNGCSYESASEKLKKDLEIAMAAVKEDRGILWVMADDIFGKIEIEPEIVKSIEYEFSPELEEKLEMIIDLAHKHENLPINKELKTVTQKLRDMLNNVTMRTQKTTRMITQLFHEHLSRDLMIEYVKQTNSLEFATNDLKNDRNFIMENKISPTFATESIQNDRELILYLIRNSNLNFRILLYKFKNDKQMIIEATKQNPYAIEHASSTLLTDTYFQLELVGECVKSWSYRQFLALRWFFGVLFRYVKDHELWKDLCKLDGSFLQFAPESLRLNEELIEISFNQCGYYGGDEMEKYYPKRMKLEYPELIDSPTLQRLQRMDY